MKTAGVGVSIIEVTIFIHIYEPVHYLLYLDKS